MGSASPPREGASRALSAYHTWPLLSDAPLAWLREPSEWARTGDWSIGKKIGRLNVIMPVNQNDRLVRRAVALGVDDGSSRRRKQPGRESDAREIVGEPLGATGTVFPA